MQGSSHFYRELSLCNPYQLKKYHGCIHVVKDIIVISKLMFYLVSNPIALPWINARFNFLDRFSLIIRLNAYKLRWYFMAIKVSHAGVKKMQLIIVGRRRNTGIICPLGPWQTSYSRSLDLIDQFISYILVYLIAKWFHMSELKISHLNNYLRTILA